VEILADDLEVKGILCDYLSYFRTDTDAAPAISFKLERHDEKKLQIPEDAYWFLNYHGIAGFEKEGKYYYACGESVLMFDPDSSGIDGIIGDEIMSIPRYFAYGLFTIVLMESLRYHGLYYLHGAALISPQGRSIVITGEGATGKTTITVSLIRLGWKWLTDDTLFISNGTHGLKLLPFMREFHIPPKLAEKIEELRFLLNAPPYFPYNPKRAVKGESIYGNQQVSSINRPDMVLFTYIVDEPVSRVEKMSALEALNKIIRMSPFVLFSQGAAKAHLEALKEIVEGADCYKLYSGRDMVESPIAAMRGILRLISEA